jgi:transposase
MADGSLFNLNIPALAIYQRFTHAISYQRLTRLFRHLFALRISEGALDTMLQRAKPCFDTEVAGILARLRRSRLVCSDETTVRINGRTHWDWAVPAKVPPVRSIGGKQAEGFQSDQVVINVIRNSRAASVVSEVMADHRPSTWVSNLYGAQPGHADL